jgi:hypothetical protein
MIEKRNPSDCILYVYRICKHDYLEEDPNGTMQIKIVVSRRVHARTEVVNVIITNSFGLHKDTCPE